MTHYTNKSARNHDAHSRATMTLFLRIEKHLMKTKWLVAFFWYHLSVLLAVYISIMHVYVFLFIHSSVNVSLFYTAVALPWNEKNGTFPTRNGLDRMSYRVMWCSSFSIKIEILKHSTRNFCIHKNFPFSCDTVEADKRIAIAPEKNEEGKKKRRQ